MDVIKLTTDDACPRHLIEMHGVRFTDLNHTMYRIPNDTNDVAYLIRRPALCR